MNKQQKLDRIKACGYNIEVNERRTIKYIATLGKLKYEARNMHQLHKQIFGY